VSATCPYCRCAFEAQDAIKTCRDCATPHHQDCFSENGGCSVFGCLNAPGDEPAVKIRIEDLADHFSSCPPVSDPPAALEPAWEPESYVASRQRQALERPRFGVVLERPCPAPPYLPVSLLLSFSIMTGGLFLLVWDLTLAKWMREIQPKSRAFSCYCAVAVLHVLALAALIGGQIYERNGLGIRLFTAAVMVLSLVARFSLRNSLEEYFDQTGPVGLSLSEAMTFFFGSIYFQYQLNRVMKQKEHRAQVMA
jgi:hypothetical protein